ncbi:MAG: DUF853 family protein [Xanthomonadales bacterium]|nr:DUF853 family protein [Xanthomonadales bacterium]
MIDPSRLTLALGAEPIALLSRYGNRHGLIAGATGTGKTVTLQVLAEAFSARGVPVFMADVKGDLAGLSQPGSMSERFARRLELLGIKDWQPDRFPVIPWDLYGEQGHPLRTTPSEIGPLLLSRMLGLNDVQEGVLQVVFKVADDNGLLLLDLKDLRAMLTHVSEHAKEISAQYGLVSTTSIAAVQRALLGLQQEGADQFFGEPALQLEDLLRPAADGRGPIHILAADKLILRPRIYTSFLLWLLSELFEELPEVGDLDRPKLVFFFDEAHLLFDDAPAELKNRIEQVVRLIRSKGVGVYFISQHPNDIPDDVLGQLGNRVQHALRAFTPRDQKAVKVAAETFVQNPDLDIQAAITQMGVGEALLSMLGDKGVPQMVQRAYVLPPASRIGTIDDAERRALIAASPLAHSYAGTIDRESAYEQLQKRAEQRAAPPPAPAAEPERKAEPAPRRSNRQSATEAFVKSTLRSLGSQLGRQLVRGLLGALKR